MTERPSSDVGTEFGIRSTPPRTTEQQAISRSPTPLLSVENLQTSFETGDGTVRAVDGVSFEIQEGEILGLVGESGCGKSATSLSLLDLIRPPGTIHGGSVRFEGRDLLTKSTEELRQIRGNDISMIFQEPMTALNPVYDVGWQVGEPLRVHNEMDHPESRRRAIELMQEVGIPSAEDRVDSYPHQFSGGMRQRVMIAMALACEPRLLIADEPTTALDVTIEAQILDIIKDLSEQENMAVLLITHDLGVVAKVCDRIAVMYAGRIVEYGEITEVFANPRHPYTQGLLDCVPDPRKEIEEFAAIDGEIPDLADPPKGCNFSPRCPYSVADCETVDPRLREVAPDQFSACIWEDPE